MAATRSSLLASLGSLRSAARVSWRPSMLTLMVRSLLAIAASPRVLHVLQQRPVGRLHLVVPAGHQVVRHLDRQRQRDVAPYDAAGWVGSGSSASRMSRSTPSSKSLSAPSNRPCR